MKKKIIKVALIGSTNAGKSTFINSLIGEKISIENKKINTTQELIRGILNIHNTQIIIYDTPGLNFFIKKKFNLNKQKNKIELLETTNLVDLILFIVDVNKINLQYIRKNIEIIKLSNKPVVVVFNKIDLINKELILSYIKILNEYKLIDDFFSISAKYQKGINHIIKYLFNKSKPGKWKYSKDIISDKSDIFISNECTRNAILKYLHKEIPYNLIVKNKLFKTINKKNIKIKQLIEINNLRYKSIILGKNGENIKRIRESSQKNIENIFNSKIHLYLEVIYVNAK